ncbi:MAG TPA: hypothetical protein VEK55_03165, partial [Xanthobacteraceae bacterium]|nr:hypothetical protein [Xanthobacteraceae bacterium]
MMPKQPVNIDVGNGESDGQALLSGALDEGESYFGQYTQGAAGAIDGSVAFGNGDPSADLTGNSGTAAAGTGDVFGVAVPAMTQATGRDLFVGSRGGEGIGPASHTPYDLLHHSADGVPDFSGTAAGSFSGFGAAGAPPAGAFAAATGIWAGQNFGLGTTAPVSGAVPSTAPSSSPSAPPAAGIADVATLANPAPGTIPPAITGAAVGASGATPAQVQAALGESGLSDTGAGIKVGVLSDSFNDLGGAAADEADGALPPASDIQILKDLPSGGIDEGRAMMQIIHDIAPGASLAFYTAFESEQDFANGILALAAAGCKVIVDDVS